MTTTLPSYLTTKPAPVSPAPTTVRLQALYASTSAQRQSNPTGYSANVSWWSGLIEELLRSGQVGEDHLVLKVDEGLLGKLEWNGGRPRGIGGVVERLSTTLPNTLYPLAQYINSPTALHAQASLTSRFIGRPLWWAVSQLNPFGSSEEAVVKEDALWSKFGKGKEYVHVPLLEQSAATFIAYTRSNPPTVYSESLYSLTTFTEDYAQICFPRRKDGKDLADERLSKRDMEVLLKWLTRDCGAVVSADGVVKVLQEGERVQDHPITEADKGTVTIRDTLNKLDQQVESIEKQIEKCQQKAKHHLALAQKPIALSHLRSKRQLEELLLKRINSSQQLETVLRSIDQAKGDIEIMAAYETSTSTLKSILSNPALDLEHVERTTEGLAEVMANQEEVDSAIRLGGEIAVGAGGREVVDDDELRRELEEMVKDEKEAKRAEEVEARLEEKRRLEARLAEKEKERVEVPVRQEKLAAPLPTSAETSSAGVADRDPRMVEKETAEERVWRERYEDAQQRKKEEAARANAERMQRDAKMAAE